MQPKQTYKVKRSPGSNVFCAPAALSILTGEHVDDCVKLIQEEIGNKSISGVYYPIILKILKNRFGYLSRDLGGFSTTNPCLLCFQSHVGVWTPEGNFVDNNYPDGTKQLPHAKIQRILEIYSSPEAKETNLLLDSPKAKEPNLLLEIANSWKDSQTLT
jgi:hypothetical protein